MIHIEKMTELAVHCAREAGRLSLERLDKPFSITYKTSHSDLVTDVDVEVERAVIHLIRESYPQHGILGEEGTCKDGIMGRDTVWVIDPIDGTTNYVHQRQNYAVSIAIYHKGQGMVGVVYDPTRDELFQAVSGGGAFLNGQRLQLRKHIPLKEALLCTSMLWNKRAEGTPLNQKVREIAARSRGVRLFGCASLELAYVAASRVDAYFNLSLNPWDFGAGKIIVEEAGGRVTQLTGEPTVYDEKGSIFACVPGLDEELMAILRG